jgi:hypothetical protein
LIANTSYLVGHSDSTFRQTLSFLEVFAFVFSDRRNANFSIAKIERKEEEGKIN